MNMVVECCSKPTQQARRSRRIAARSDGSLLRALRGSSLRGMRRSAEPNSREDDTATQRAGRNLHHGLTQRRFGIH